MRCEDITELHYIAPLVNIPSIMKYGLLSYNRAKTVHHHSIAMPEIQARRACKWVPGGRPLHDYVNLYFHARNPMLYKRLAQHLHLCVLSINTTVLDWYGVIVTDGNAASHYTAFWPSPAGLEHLNYNEVFADRWNDPCEIVKWEQARKKCAEVLVPHRVGPQYILGAYVSL